MSDSTNNENPEGAGYWGWFSNAAVKAQEFAEAAKKVAQEQAAIIATKAQEIKENYDLEVATTMLMSSVGGSVPTKGGLSHPDEPVKLTKEELSQLDMIYITENLIGMAYPRERHELQQGKKITSEEGGSEGNDINVVAAYLQKRHPGKFMIWNISEETYDYSKFQEQVLEYKFPGHPAPPLGLLFKICTSIESWLDADDQNVAVVHCLTGKGRTATLMACVLTWLGEFDSPMQALTYVAQRRSTAVDYLTIPSQRRYLQYFSNLLDGVKPNSEPLLLRRIIINSIPGFGYMNSEDSSTQGCCPYIQIFKNGKLISSAAAVNEKVHHHQESADAQNPTANAMKLRWVTQTEGSATFKIDCIVQGDVLVRCRHASLSGARISMFRAAFHTGYVSGGVLRLTKAQLDGATTDLRYPDDFFVDLIFSTIDPNTLNESNLNKDLLDAAMQDKYESGLHKDAKFWEAVTARKNKQKRRKSRKFSSDQKDPFSIMGDDSKLIHEHTHGHEDEQEEMTFSKFTSKFQPTSSSNSQKDMELINLLAQAEDDSAEIPSINSKAVASANVESGNNNNARGGLTSPTAKKELQALEDLEKELGLTDLQLFSNEKSKPTSGTESSSATKPKETTTESAGKTSKMEEIDDNLDELERYLQSLSSPN
jgi:hypothetical protein